jgi:hypothetical protein
VQTQSFQVFLEALCVGQGLHLDEISKFHVSVSKIGVVIRVGRKGSLPWPLQSLKCLMKAIITIWLQVKSAGLPERWLSIDAGISPIQILTKILAN